MIMPERLKAYVGRKALVDGIPFTMPVGARESPVLVAIFPINADKAAELLEGEETSPIEFNNTALLIVTVIDYRQTVIGSYIEYSIGIGCTHSSSPCEFKLPGLFTKTFSLGQFVVDLPVSSEISVKGGKGIWGMPKHRAALDFKIGDDKISSQYDLDGKLCSYVEIDRPDSINMPLKMGASNFCTYRGMIWKSDVYFAGTAGFCVGPHAKGKFIIGDHPRVQKLKALDISPDPIATAFIPSAQGILDDQVQGWFMHYPETPDKQPEGMESVVDLGLEETWLPAPDAPVPGVS